MVGNEIADRLAKEVSAKEPDIESTTYKDTKTITRTKQHQKWLQQRPNCSRTDSCYCLTWPEQVANFCRTDCCYCLTRPEQVANFSRTDSCYCLTWSEQVANFSRTVGCYCLTRPEQVANFKWTDTCDCLTWPEQVAQDSFGLHTGHNRMKYNLYTKLGISKSVLCSCSTGNTTADHLLQSFSALRNRSNYSK